MLTAPDKAAEAIRGEVMQEVVDRLVTGARDLPPAVIPIVAANVAMSGTVSRLLDTAPYDRAEVMAELLDLLAPATPVGGYEQL